MPRPKRKQVILPEATPVGVLYTTDEIAQLMKTTRRTVQRWIREGKLQAVQVGGQYRVRQDALAAFQKER